VAGDTTRRGYGTQHQRIRAYWKPLVATGRELCRRCEEPILPGEPWDLGHDDANRQRYRGPEHRACNRSAGATQGNLARGDGGRPLTSEDW
jgi:hypothetical protein